MRATWHGHACFEIAGEKRVLIDPFLRGNPTADIGPDDVHPDILLITHGHEDHLGDAVEIARRAKPKVACIHEISVYLGEEGIEAEGMNFYGTLDLGGVRVTMVPAWHSSSHAGRYMGTPAGFVIEMDGRRIYHAGDTGLFSDMGLIGELFKPDLFLVPIGDRYTLSPALAARAVELVSPRVAIPMHFGTFPVLVKEATEFRELVEAKGKTKAVILRPGESYEL